MRRMVHGFKKLSLPSYTVNCLANVGYECTYDMLILASRTVAMVTTTGDSEGDRVLEEQIQQITVEKRTLTVSYVKCVVKQI